MPLDGLNTTDIASINARPIPYDKLIPLPSRVRGTSLETRMHHLRAFHLFRGLWPVRAPLPSAAESEKVSDDVGQHRYSKCCSGRRLRARDNCLIRIER